MIIPAVDFSTRDDVLRFLEQVPDVRWLKIGMELGDAIGPSIYDELIAEGYKVFDDAKIHDIPKTMGRCAAVHTARKPSMLNCMAAGGVEGMRAVAGECSSNGVMSVAVTVLTSQDQDDCVYEHGRPPSAQVMEVYAPWALEAGIDALVCSPHELESLNDDEDFCAFHKITPGIRPEWAQADGQTRFMTPSEAVRLHADYLVIGSPITSPKYGQPAENFHRICEEVAAAQ